MEKYLIKIDYHCPEVKTGGQWVVIEGNEKPCLGVIGKTLFGNNGPLPQHGCKKYYESQLCEDDKTCFWQTILEVRQFSKEEAKRLNARSLEAKCKV